MIYVNFLNESGCHEMGWVLEYADGGILCLAGDLEEAANCVEDMDDFGEIKLTEA